MTRTSLYLSALLCALGAAPALAQRGPKDPAAARELPPPVVPAPLPGEKYLRVMALGDWGSGLPDQKRVAAAMAERAAAEPIDLVLTLGDNFYPSGVRSADDPRWQRDFERMYDQPSLQVPWWACLGNHDHKGNVDAQVEYTRRSARWKMPARHYHTRFEPGPGVSVELFVLDTQALLARDGDQAQLDWLKAALAASTARWKVVAGHHPIVSHGSHGNNERLQRLLEPLLLAHQVDLYMAGHDHTLELLPPRQGLTYLISGGGAGASWAYEVSWPEDVLYAATGGGFACLRFGRDECVVEFVRLDARTQYARLLLKPDARLGPY